jgi:hypothetical protein
MGKPDVEELQALAEQVFRTVTPLEKLTAMDEYRAKQAGELDKMARLRAMRLAKEAATLVDPSVKLKARMATPR